MQRLVIICTVVLLLCWASPALAAKDEWKPIEPAHMALKAPLVEKDADAEAIFWEVYVKDELDGSSPRTVLNHYLRIKIFTERGRDSQTKIDIPYLGRNQIKDIAGRTIKPDGTIVELKKDAIFERTILNTKGFKVKAKSFAMPAVEPGVIIEYKWKEIRGISFNVHLDFQRDIPVQLIKYYIKPLSLPNLPFGMRARTFNGNSTPFVKEKDGYSSTSMSNVPAYRAEPRMPPEDSVQPWMLIYYEEDKKQTIEQYWQSVGQEFYEGLKDNLKPNDDIKRAAASIVGTSADPKEKIEKIFQFCRTKIKNVDYLQSTDKEDDRAEKNRTPGDVLRYGVGDSGDVTKLFTSLLLAAGLEARIARQGDRGDFFFDVSFTNSYFMRSLQVAVKVGDTWQFYDPATAYLPFGVSRWQEEGMPALICDEKSFFVQTPITGADKSVEKRVARLRLSEDGNLEGTVRIEYTGHFNVDKKRQNIDDSANEREETLRELIKKRLGNAEVSHIEIKNVDEIDKPFTYSYYIRIPGYAQRTGKRLFIQPAFFQKGLTALFPASERKHPIYFHYPWSEEDDVAIEMPAGYQLDSPSVPAPMAVAGVSKYNVKLSISSDKKVFYYRRNFSFGESGSLYYPSNSYQPLKQLFDVVFERDSHTLTLKQIPATVPTTNQPATSQPTTNQPAGQQGGGQ